MSLVPTYPGVYVLEPPSGVHTVIGVATSIAAFNGWVKRGPLDSATQIFNWGDFQRVFGGLDGSELAYAVYTYYQNGGGEAYVTRVVDSTAATAWAQASPPTKGGAAAGGKPVTGPPAGQPAIFAASPGAWGNNVYVYVDYALPGPRPASSPLFNLQAMEFAKTNGVYAARASIQLAGVSLQPGPTNVVTQLANFDNPLIAFADPMNPGGPPPKMPLPTGSVGASVATASVAAKTIKTLNVAVTSGANTLTYAPSVGAYDDPIDAAIGLKAAFAGIPGLASAQVSVVQLAADHVQFRVVLTDPALAAATVAFTGDVAANLGLSGSTATSNVQAYVLGYGADGSAPNAVELIGDPTLQTGLYALEQVDLFNLLSMPDLRTLADDDYTAVGSAAAAYCHKRRAILLADLPQPVVTGSLGSAQKWIQSNAPNTFGPNAINAAGYWPEPVIPDPLNNMNPRQVAVSGIMAGIYATTDVSRGVWKAPAGIGAPLSGLLNLSLTLTDDQNGTINPMGLNAMRIFPVYGTVPWGARTLAGADALASDWKYLPVRRTALYIEESLYRGLKWVVFEPNGTVLWSQIRLNVSAFLQNMFQQGAFFGTAPNQAYFVRCDGSTTSSYDIDAGIVNIQVGFAPLKPAEFVILSLSQMTAQSSSS